MSAIDLPNDFGAEVRASKANFLVRGVLGTNDRVYPLGSDTKVLSTVFELFTRPLLLKIAHRHGYRIEESPQTVYPDFTLLRSKDDPAKIAVDVKTTYRRPTIQYTLGSYTSFLRNATKNILYPYSQYQTHWIIGFVYDRREVPSSSHLPLNQRHKLAVPYGAVDWFVQEKYKIAGDSPGSGNTANIGSIRSASIADFVIGNGPFAKHGEAVFQDYWANYDRSPASRSYASFREYLVWREKTR